MCQTGSGVFKGPVAEGAASPMEADMIQVQGAGWRAPEEARDLGAGSCQASAGCSEEFYFDAKNSENKTKASFPLEIQQSGCQLQDIIHCLFIY